MNAPFTSMLVRRGEAVLLIHGNGFEEIVVGPKRIRLRPLDLQESLERVIVDENSQIIVTREDGSREIIEGPRELFVNLKREKYAEMTRLVIEQNQRCYVVLEDGTEKMFEGGQTIFVRPTEKHVLVLENIVHEGTAVVVVDEQGRRAVKKGSARFFLNPREGLYIFRWTGGPRKEPRSLQFQIIRTTPDQMYHDVEVRTKDQVILTVKLMIYWQIIDVEKMIHRCDDLIGAMVNIISSAVATCFGSLAFEEAATNTEELVKKIGVFADTKLWDEYGVKIEQVRLRGWQCADPQIQEILDEKIRNRTQIESQEELLHARHDLVMQEITQQEKELRERGSLTDLRIKQAQSDAKEAGARRGEEIKRVFETLLEIAGGERERAMALLSQELALQTIQQAKGPLILSAKDVGLNINLENHGTR